MAEERRRFFRVQAAGEAPESLLDPQHQRSRPWDGGDRGRCPKCGGSGRTEHICLSCQAGGEDPGCPSCHGELRYVDTCPACKGTGVVTDHERRGVSVFPDVEALFRYLLRRGADLDHGSTLVELEGELSADDDFDADEGAILVFPERIVRTTPVDQQRVARLREQLHQAGPI